MTDTIWVCRHGQRQDTVDPLWDDNADRVHDPGLTELGKWQGWRTGVRLLGTGIGSIYTSPYLRAVETAAEVAAELELLVRVEPGLGEHLNPDWFDEHPARLSDEDLEAIFDPLVLDHRPHVEPTFPEAVDEARTRAGEAARHLAEAADDPVLLVGHGLTVYGVVEGLTGSTEHADAPLAGLTRLDRRDGEWHLSFSGETRHLHPE